MTNGAQPKLTGEVAGALAAGRPVVALETTLVSHGFPGGQGVEVALHLSLLRLGKRSIGILRQQVADAATVRFHRRLPAASAATNCSPFWSRSLMGDRVH